MIMEKTIFLVPPNKEGYIRDTFYGCWHKPKFLNYYWPPIHYQYLKSIISDSKIIDSPALGFDKKGTLKILISENPSFLVINTGTFLFEHDINFIKEIKTKLDVKIILYGQHPTQCPRESLKHECVDFLIKGEPEPVLYDIICNKNNKSYLKRLKGVCFDNHISPVISVVDDLDKLPIPSRNIFSEERYSNPLAVSHPFTSILASRGCDYKCSFCTVPLISGKYRSRTVSNVIDELRLLRNQGFKELFFRDENFLYDSKFIKKLCKAIVKEKLNFTWMCNARVDSINEEVISLMKRSGCHLIKLGVETNSQDILNEYDKNVTIEQTKKAFRICNNYDIDTLSHFIIGLNKESHDSIIKLVDFANSLDATYASFDSLIRYPNQKIKIMNNEQELNYFHNLAFRKFFLSSKTIFNNIINTKSMYQFKNKVKSTFKLWSNILR